MKLLLICLVLTTGCATGGTNIKEMSGGSFIRTDYVRDTGAITKGGTYEAYFRCDSGKTNCIKVGELVTSNPTLAEQFMGGVSQIGSAAILADGLRNSGDTVNQNNNQRQVQNQSVRKMRREWSGD